MNPRWAGAIGRKRLGKSSESPAAPCRAIAANAMSPSEKCRFRLHFPRVFLQLE